MQPYREPATVVVPPPRIESVQLRRFPLVLQLFMLAWFPAAAIGVAELFPTVDLVCTREPAAECVLHSRTAVRHRARPVAVEASAVQADGPTLRVALAASEEVERFDLGDSEAQKAAEDFQRFVAGPEHEWLDRPIRSTRWFVLLCAVGELTILAYYLFAQVRFRIAINRDTGTASIHLHRRFRATKTQTLDLGAISEIYLEDLDENGHGQAVYARRGEKKTRLFDAINVEARRGMEFLEDGRARWKAQGNETSAAPE